MLTKSPFLQKRWALLFSGGHMDENRKQKWNSTFFLSIYVKKGAIWFIALRSESRGGENDFRKLLFKSKKYFIQETN